ncbi:MAG: hypothetical protein ACKO7W_18685 [Elainella sp.]
MNEPPHSPLHRRPPKKHALRTHLLFYAIAVSTVLGLFQLTTAYGEANLKAPPNLNGRYLTDATAPGCPSDSRLVLTIQQSGRYLNAALELASANQTQTPPPQAFGLRGNWRQQISLAGSAPALAACQQPTDLTLEANVQANSPDSPRLTGQMQLNNQPWPFTAQQQAVAAPQISH